jgi:two-component system sensor histidine kinase KdpD
VAAAALLTLVLTHFRQEVGTLDSGLVYLALTLLIASVWGRRVAVVAAAVDYLCLNYFFIEPLHKITVHDPKNLGAWILEVSVFLGVALVGARRA